MSHDREESKEKNRNHVVTDYRPSTHVARDPGDEGVPSLSRARARARALLEDGGEKGESQGPRLHYVAMAFRGIRLIPGSKRSIKDSACNCVRS